MPKIHLTEKDRLKAFYHERDQCFLDALLVRLRRKKMRQQDLEPLLGLSRATVWRRLKDPGQLTIRQARVLFDALGFSDEERMSLVSRRITKGGEHQ